MGWATSGLLLKDALGVLVAHLASNLHCSPEPWTLGILVHLAHIFHTSLALASWPFPWCVIAQQTIPLNRVGLKQPPFCPSFEGQELGWGTNGADWSLLCGLSWDERLRDGSRGGSIPKGWAPLYRCFCTFCLQHNAIFLMSCWPKPVKTKPRVTRNDYARWGFSGTANGTAYP